MRHELVDVGIHVIGMYALEGEEPSLHTFKIQLQGISSRCNLLFGSSQSQLYLLFTLLLALGTLWIWYGVWYGPFLIMELKGTSNGIIISARWLDVCVCVCVIT
jgi:hypothetical protein